MKDTYFVTLNIGGNSYTTHGTTLIYNKDSDRLVCVPLATLRVKVYLPTLFKGLEEYKKNFFDPTLKVREDDSVAIGLGVNKFVKQILLQNLCIDFLKVGLSLDSFVDAGSLYKLFTASTFGSKWDLSYFLKSYGSSTFLKMVLIINNDYDLINAIHIQSRSPFREQSVLSWVLKQSTINNLAQCVLPTPLEGKLVKYSLKSRAFVSLIETLEETDKLSSFLNFERFDIGKHGMFNVEAYPKLFNNVGITFIYDLVRRKQLDSMYHFTISPDVFSINWSSGKAKRSIEEEMDDLLPTINNILPATFSNKAYNLIKLHGFLLGGVNFEGSFQDKKSTGEAARILLPDNIIDYIMKDSFLHDALFKAKEKPNNYKGGLLLYVKLKNSDTNTKQNILRGASTDICERYLDGRHENAVRKRNYIDERDY